MFTASIRKVFSKSNNCTMLSLSQTCLSKDTSYVTHTRTEHWLKPIYSFKTLIISYSCIFTGLKNFSEIAFAARS